MDKLQFFHEQNSYDGAIKRERTIACYVPDTDKIIRLINYKLTGLGSHMMILIGTAKVSPKDHYVKKIGREVSVQKCTLKNFRLVNVQFFIDTIEVTLTSGEETIILQLKLGRTHPHLIGVHTWN